MSAVPPGLPSTPVNPTSPAPLATDPLTTQAPPVEEMIDLPRGKELDTVAATKLQVARPVRMIVLAGPVASGKTTLLNTVNDLFQEGKIDADSFSGSMTLPAFEERCHPSRTASERAAQETGHTQLTDARYLHVRVSEVDLNLDPVDLLFTDISGETFEDARNSIPECQELTFLRTADHFLLVLDCEKIVDLKKRNKVIHEAMGILRQCLDSEMLSSSCFVNVLWAKYDWIAASNDAEHKSFLQKAMKEFQDQFASRVGKLSFTEVAARPDRGDLKLGHGIPELLKNWVVTSPGHREMKLVPEGTGDRESEKFLDRHFNAVRGS